MKKSVKFIPFFLIAVVCFFILSPMIFSHEWHQAHDGFRYILLTLEFRESIMNGVLYPRWLPNIYGGYGYPWFIFYQPGIFYCATLWSLVFGNLIYAMHASIFFLFFMGGIGAYFVSFKIIKNRFLSFVGAVLFLVTPYIYCNLYVRGDISELGAMLLCPWPYYFLLQLKDEVRQGNYFAGICQAVCISVFLALIVYFHPITAFIFFPVFGASSLLEVVSNKKINFSLLKIIIISILLAIVLSAPYWISMFSMKEYVSFHKLTGDYFQLQDHFVFIKQLFSNFWGFGTSNAGPEDGMSFQLGAIHFILACCGVVFCRKNKFIMGSFIFYVVLIILMTPLSRIIWESVGMSQLVQFPWRILSVTATLQLICIAGFLSYMSKFSYKISISMISIIFIGFFSVHHTQFKSNGTIKDSLKVIENYKQMRLLRFTSLSMSNAFLPNTVNLSQISSARSNKPMIQIYPVGTMKALPESSECHMKFDFIAVQPSVLIINQFYFPGWKIILNGKVISEKAIRNSLSPDGRMIVKVFKGLNQEIEVYYDGPLHKNIINGVVLFLCFIFVGLFFCKRWILSDKFWKITKKEIN